MTIERQIDDAKRRLRDWWNDPAALGRPVVLCNYPKFHARPRKQWGYFTYAELLIKLLGNDALKPQLRAAQDAPYNAIPPLPRAPTGVAVDFHDPANAAILARVRDQIDATLTADPWGDEIPILRSQAGPGFPACCMGEYSCLPTTGPATIWYETVRRWPELEHLELDTTSPWWQFTIEITRRHLDDAPGWVGVGFPSMQGPTDILQTLRGTQHLVRDMLKEGERVKKTLDRIDEIYRDAVDHFWDEIRRKRDGTGSFIGIWAPGKAPSVQCDALAYLGPRQFERFALPYIRADLEAAEFGTYHLDGPGALKFVDDLLRLPSLHLIQWVEGAGNPDGVAMAWYPLVKKVLAAGKRVLLYTRADRIPHFIRRLQRDGVDPRRVVFSIGNVQRYEIEQFLPWLEAEPDRLAGRDWYPDGFWTEYEELLRDDPKRYADLEHDVQGIRDV